MLFIFVVCQQEAQILQFDESHHGDTLRLAPRQIFEIELGSNPTTGYRWHWVEQDTTMLSLEDREYQPAAEKIGAAGIERFTFKTQNEGKTELKLLYRRSWEDKQAAMDSFVVNIVVTLDN
jgi:inhibitor of cysteine peptidase